MDDFTSQSPSDQDVRSSGIGDAASPNAEKGMSGVASHYLRGNAEAPGETGVSNDAGLFGAIRAAIQRQVRYPSRARRAGLEGTVYVRLRFVADGPVPSLEIARSSGHTDLDDAAVKAVNRSLPLPHSRRAFDVTIPIVFQLQ